MHSSDLSLFEKLLQHKQNPILFPRRSLIMKKNSMSTANIKPDKQSEKEKKYSLLIVEKNINALKSVKLKNEQIKDTIKTPIFLIRPLSSKIIQPNVQENEYLPLFAKKIEIKQLVVNKDNEITRNNLLRHNSFHPKLRIPDQNKILLKNEVLNQSFNGYSFYVKEGNNNSQLIRKILQKRTWWKEVLTNSCNFQWFPVSNGFRFEKLKTQFCGFQIQAFNHFEFHRELSLKSKMFQNIEKYCRDRNINLFDICPITFYLDADSNNYIEEMKNFTVCFTAMAMKDKKRTIKIQNDANIFVKKIIGMTNNNINNNENTKKIKKNKKGIEDFYNFNNNKMNIFIPPTFLADKNIWLLKPTHLNRGRGIKIFNDLNVLNRYLIEFYGENNNEIEFVTDLKEKKNLNSQRNCHSSCDQRANHIKINSKEKITKFILQKYIEKPFLIDSRKFDIRVWVLISQDINLYFFKEGYIRTSSENFDLNDDNLQNTYIHLTNNAIQKNCKNYGQFESGNQLSFYEFQIYLKKKKIDIDFKKNIISKMKEFITISVESVANKLNPKNYKNCFEIFGYDFIIDEAFNLWLIEINTNPCIEESSPILQKLIPRMLDDAFKITLDVIFPPVFSQKLMKKSNCETVFNVDGYSDEENLWEYLGNFQKSNV